MNIFYLFTEIYSSLGESFWNNIGECYEVVSNSYYFSNMFFTSVADPDPGSGVGKNQDPDPG